MTAYDDLINGVNARVFNSKQPQILPTLNRNRGPYKTGYGTGPVAAPPPVTAQRQQTPADPYVNGGDGSVAREMQPRDRTVDVGLGIPKDEMIRRMDIASRSYAGSPTARAAMMGVYADGLKAMDAVGINNAEGNSRNDGLAFQQNMQANMQQAQGKQQFGNDVAMLNRKANAELAIVNATATAKLDPEMRALDMAKKRAEIDNLTSKGGVDAAKFDAEAQSNADKSINARAAQISGGSDDPAVVAAATQQAAREYISFNGSADSTASKAQLNADGTAIGGSLGAWKRLGGFWTDNDTRPMPAGAVVDPGDVTTDYGTEEDDNNFNDWFGGIPWVEKDRRVVYTNPETGEKHTQWLDPGEAADANILNAVDAYGTPAYRKAMEERKKLGQARSK